MVMLRAECFSLGPESDVLHVGPLVKAAYTYSTLELISQLASGSIAAVHALATSRRVLPTQHTNTNINTNKQQH
jgi:hypothetical protein